jgi:hypothetical protein
MPRTFPFDELTGCPLIVDAVYKGGSAGHVADDPISPLTGVGNQGGFRPLGSIKDGGVKYTVLYSSLEDPDWPDHLDEELGVFTYFGDNKKPGYALHDTKKKGNVLLRDTFDALHRKDYKVIPPFLVFAKGAEGRDVVFKGIAVPGARGFGATEDLIAVWKSKKGERFQNYKATFTILDIPEVSREWLKELASNKRERILQPEAFSYFSDTGIYRPLVTSRSIEYRTKEEQIPKVSNDLNIIKVIHNYFGDDSYGFERCAADLFDMSDQNVVACDLTRPWVDGGRDAVGKYRIGLPSNAVIVEFALEAKCYGLENSIRVRQTSRLISRIRHRQFGVLVTTSFVHHQAYKEIKEDGHPIIIISAIDIVQILKRSGMNRANDVKKWLESKYPKLK